MSTSLSPSVNTLSYLNSHPMESSRLLNSLIDIVQTVENSPSGSPIDEIINTQILRRLLTAIHFRDIQTLKHSRRVGIISVGIGSRLGWEDSELRLIEIASLLHDVGKIGIPDHILQKPGRLSPDEAEYIASHHRVAIEILQATQASQELIQIVAQAHGVKVDTDDSNEKTSSLGARILAVADAFESLTSARSYRPAFDEKSALKILHEQSGKEFDRNIVAALERWLDSHESRGLHDNSAAEAAVQANAPTTDSAKANAACFCQLFQYLHLMESLYDAFYLIDDKRRVVIWSMGAAKLFGFPAVDLIGQPWHRSVVTANGPKPDPVEVAFQSAQSNCHALTLKDLEGNDQEFDVQTVPILDLNQRVVATAELICDGNESKKHRGQFRKLHMAATRDALTGVVNRGELDDKMIQVFNKWNSEPTIPFSIVFLDIDHFKEINDRLSHSVGDRVLIDVARLIQDELYSGEIVSRYGGEEFVILCPETPLETALERAERLRRAIMGTKIAEREDLRVTASFGVAQVEPNDDPESLMKAADKALYEAKNSGRNRTCHRKISAVQTAPTTEQKKQSDWIHHAEITTCVASSMLHIKLKGYVLDNMAKILDVKEDSLLLQVGSPGLLGGWGNKQERQPVKVWIDIHKLPNNEKVSGTRRILLKTRTEPIGRPAKKDTFHTRAAIVVESLRSYLIAD